MRKTLVYILILLSTSQIFSQDVNTFFEMANDFFEINVSKGYVDYASIHKNQKALNELMMVADKINVIDNDDKTYQAFWINAYNLAVIKGVINHYPTKSPLDHEGFFDKITYQIGGNEVTLNQIEHQFLRAKFNDARFHFVLVCGAIGCPPLINKAYLPTTLDSQLQLQAQKSINGAFIKVNMKKKKVEVSEILKWYKEDFTLNGISEIEYLNQFRKEPIPLDFKLSYFPYNWNLNSQ